MADNIYAVPRHASLLDFQTYKLIMAAPGIDFIEMASPPAGLQSVEGCLKTRERVILLERAREMFGLRLAGSLALDTEVRSIRSHDRHAEINGQRFDYVIDATWGQCQALPIDVYFEPTLLLYYDCAEPVPALTFVDGPLCSVHPTEDPAIHTLSSVAHTPLGRYGSAAEAKARRAAGRAVLQGRRCA